MPIVFVLVWIIAAVALYYFPGFVVRWLAKNARIYLFTPANTLSVIVTYQKPDDDPVEKKADGKSEEKKAEPASSSGPIRNAIHGIPGATLNKSNPNPMNWEMVEGKEDPDHRGLIYTLYGVQPMGSVWWKPRINIDRRLRFAREKDEGELKNVTKVHRTPHVYYTGELTVSIKGADTKDKLGLNIDVDFVFKRRYPIRSILKLADSGAFLTSLVENVVNNFTTLHNAEDIYGSDQAKTLREQLVHEIADSKEFADSILDELGLDITKVSLRDVDLTPEHKKLIEAKTKAEREGAAKIEAAEKDKQARILSADAKEREEMVDVNVSTSYFNNVLKPAAENSELARLIEVDRRARAYEKNNTVTTYAPGTEPVLPLDK